MNTLKHLTRLSTDELRELETAILNEISRRQGSQAPPLAIILGEVRRRNQLSAEAMAAPGGQTAGKGGNRAARPAAPRRAA